MMTINSFLPFGILLTGLLGSVHCVGMCGPLVLASTRTTLERFLYNVGRLTGYIFLGALMGTLGRLLFQNTYYKLQLAGAVFVAFLLILYGIQGLFNMSSFKVKSEIFSKFFAKNLKWIMSLPKSMSVVKSFVFGLATSFLPCGFLYSVALGAVISESPLKGALVLLFFWLGTLPALMLAPTLLSVLFKRLPWVSPKFVSVAFVVIGCVVFYSKLQFLGMSFGHDCCSK